MFGCESFSAGTFFFPPHHHIENALWSFPFCFTVTENDNLSCKELRECKITCHYPVNGNIKKSSSAEIVVGQLWVLKICRNALLFLPFHIKFKSCSEADDHSRRVALAVVSWLLASARGCRSDGRLCLMTSADLYQIYSDYL